MPQQRRHMSSAPHNETIKRAMIKQEEEIFFSTFLLNKMENSLFWLQPFIYLALSITWNVVPSIGLKAKCFPQPQVYTFLGYYMDIKTKTNCPFAAEGKL